MAEFMMLFLGIKPNSTYKFNKLISSKVKQTQNCMRNYSMEKFQQIKKFDELRILIAKIYNCNLEELFSETKTMKMNYGRYTNVIEELIDTK